MFKYRSCGKINSFLNVLSEMSNGYHKINTHFQLIDIFDDIQIRVFNDSRYFWYILVPTISELNYDFCIYICIKIKLAL